MAIKTPYVRNKTSLQTAIVSVNPNNNIYVIGKRGIVNSVTLLPDLFPLANFPKISLYKPFQLPSFGSGNECLSFLKSCGFSIGFGQSDTLNLPVANSVTTTPSTSTYTLTYAGIPHGFHLLVNNPIAGTVTQGSLIGIIISATIIQGNAQLVISSTSVFTTATIVVNYTNKSVTTPDRTQTEMIAMQLYSLFAELNQVGSQLTVAVDALPKVYMLVMGQNDTSYSPNTTPLVLAKPDFVTIQNSSVVLSWATMPNNWGLLPDNQLGTSMVDQGSELITGIFYQKGIGNLIGDATATAQYYIILNNVTGTFNTTDSINIILDGTQTIQTMKMNYCKYWLGYNEIKSINTNNSPDINTESFFEMINNENSLSKSTKNGGGLTFGFLSNITQSIYTINKLPILDSYYMCNSYYPEPLSSASLVQSDSSQVSAFVIACCAMNNVPFNPMNDITSKTITATNDPTFWIQKGVDLSSETVLQQGYTPLYVNNLGQVATIRVVTSKLNYQNTQIPDIEYFPLSTWQIISAWNEASNAICNLPQYKNKRQDPIILKSLLLAIIHLAEQFETNGMFSNVNSFLDKFNVVTDPNVPDEIIVHAPIQIIPELSGITIDTSIYSFLYNNQGA